MQWFSSPAHAQGNTSFATHLTIITVIGSFTLKLQVYYFQSYPSKFSQCIWKFRSWHPVPSLHGISENMWNNDTRIPGWAATTRPGELSKAWNSQTCTELDSHILGCVHPCMTWRTSFLASGLPRLSHCTLELLDAEWWTSTTDAQLLCWVSLLYKLWQEEHQFLCWFTDKPIFSS